ncbi:MAG: DUF5666 domain-containing protein [Chloroflexota bacterium]
MKIKKFSVVLALAGMLALGGIGVLAQNALAAKVEGVVDEVTDTQIKIEGITILTDNNTKIEGSITPGMTVRVKTTTQNGSPLAVSIQTQNRQMVKIVGIVDNITGNQISVKGRTVYTDNKTIVHGTLVVGAYVEIKAMKQADGSLLAFQIKVVEKNIRKHVTITGTTTNLTETSITVNRKTIQINDQTKIHGTLAIGAKVRVLAVVIPNSTQSNEYRLLALKIQVVNSLGKEVDEDDDDEDEDNANEVRLQNKESTAARLRSLVQAKKVIPAVRATPAKPAIQGKPATPATPATSATPAVTGKQVFSASCISCHTGAPNTTRTQAQLVDFISGHNTGRNLTPEQVAALAAWIKP